MGPIAASRVGFKDGQYLLNPSLEELKLLRVRPSSGWH